MGNGNGTQLQSNQRKQETLNSRLGNVAKNLQKAGSGANPLIPPQILHKPTQEDSLKQLSEGNQAYYERMLNNSRNVQLVTTIRNREELARITKGNIDQTDQEGFEVYDLSTELKFKQKLPVAQKDDKGHNLEQGALNEAKKTFEGADLCTTRELVSMKQYFSNWKNAEGPAYTGNDVPDDPALTEYVNSILSFELTLATFTDDYMSQHMPQLYEYSRKLAAYDRLKQSHPKFFESLPESSKMKLEMCADMKNEIRDILNEHMAMHGISLHTDAKNKENRVTLRRESKDRKTREEERKIRKESYEKKLKNFFTAKIDGFNEALAKRFIESNPDKETDAEKIDLKELEEKIRDSGEAFEVCGKEMNAAVNEIKKATAVRNELVGRQREYTSALDESRKKIEKINSEWNAYQENVLKKEKKGVKLTPKEHEEFEKTRRAMRNDLMRETDLRNQMRRNVARTNRRLRVVNEHIDCYREFIRFGMGETESISPETAGFIEREGHEDMLMLIRFKAAGDCIEKILAAKDMSDKLERIAKLRKEKNPVKKEMAAEKASALEQEFRESLSYVKMPKDQFYKKLKAYREANKDKEPAEDPVMTLLRDDRVTEDVMGFHKLISGEGHKEINSIFEGYTKKVLGFGSKNPDQRTDKHTGDLRSYISGNLSIMIKNSLKGGNAMKAANPQQYAVVQGDPVMLALPQIKRDKYGQIDAGSMNAYWQVKEETEDYFSGDQEKVNGVLLRIGRDMLNFSVTEEMKKNTDRYLDTNSEDYEEHKDTLVRAKGFRALYIKHRDYFESDAFTKEEKEKLHKDLLDNNDLTFILAVAETYKIPFASNPDGERIKETDYEREIRLKKEEEEKKKREEEEKKRKEEEEKKKKEEEDKKNKEEEDKKKNEEEDKNKEQEKKNEEAEEEEKKKKDEEEKNKEKEKKNQEEEEKGKNEEEEKKNQEEEEKKKKEEEEKKNQEEEEKKKKEEEEQKKKEEEQKKKEEEERLKQEEQKRKEEEDRQKREEENRRREREEKRKQEEKETERRREAERQFTQIERELLLGFWKTLKNIGDVPKKTAVKKVYQKFFEKLNANLVPDSLKYTWERVQAELVKQGEEEFQAKVKEREEARKKAEDEAKQRKDHIDKLKSETAKQRIDRVYKETEKEIENSADVMETREKKSVSAVKYSIMSGSFSTDRFTANGIKNYKLRHGRQRLPLFSKKKSDMPDEAQDKYTDFEIKAEDFERVKQNNDLYDCYLISTLAGIVKTKPDYIRQLIRDHEDPTKAIVTLYDKNGNKRDITLEKSGYDPDGSPLWVQLIEMAASTLIRNDGSGAGYRTKPATGNLSLHDLDKGNEDLASRLLFGRRGLKLSTRDDGDEFYENNVAKSEDHIMGDEAVAKMLAYLDKGKIVVSSTCSTGDSPFYNKAADAVKFPENTQLKSGHAYLVTGRGEEQDGLPTIKVRDPYNGQELTISVKEFKTCFTDIMVSGIEEEKIEAKPKVVKKPEMKKKAVDFKQPVKPALTKEQKAGIYTEENKRAYEEKLRQAKITVPSDIEQLNLERAKFQHPEYFLTSGNKWTIDFVYNKDTDKTLMECYEWLMQYYRYQIELEEGVTGVLSKVEIPKYAKTEVKTDFEYEHQSGENCWCCAGTALLKQFLASQGRQTDKEISQYAMRQFKPEKKTLEDIQKGGQPQVEQTEYEQYIREADQFIGKQKGDNSGVGSIYEAADFFYQYTDDFALNRMVFTIPGKQNQFTYTDRRGSKKVVYTNKSKKEQKRDEIIINNQKAAFLKQVKAVLDTQNLVALLVQTPYRHYVTIKGITGTKITYLDSLKTDKKKETTEDIGSFIKHFDKEAKELEITWFSPLKGQQEMQAEFRNLRADENSEEYEVRLTNEAAHNVYQTKGVSVGKRTIDMGENMHQISQSVYIPKKIKKT